MTECGSRQIENWSSLCLSASTKRSAGLGWLAENGHDQLVVSFDRTPNTVSVLDGQETALG